MRTFKSNQQSKSIPKNGPSGGLRPRLRRCRKHTAFGGAYGPAEGRVSISNK